MIVVTKVCKPGALWCDIVVYRDNATYLQQKLVQKFNYHDGELISIKTGKKLGCINNGGYVVTNRKFGTTLVHRLIYAYHHAQIPQVIDHIDNNPTNNRIENLRPATMSQNGANARVRETSKTGYKGVTKMGNRYRARITREHILHPLGWFAPADQAARVCNKAAIELFGEFANVNVMRQNLNE